MKFIITQEQLQPIVNYLGSRPYIEVMKLINILSQLEKVPNVKQEESANDKGGKIKA
tara:strand:- start:190 stop:360 length:171 start_codon:yes stop_codon:yes gene_type:complete